MVDGSRVTRRAALGCLASGGFLAASGTFGFDSLGATRGVNVSTASDPDAIVGLLVNDPVKKNSQELLVDVENTTDQDLSVTVSLDDCTQGTLYAPNGDSGCSVTFALGAGSTGSVDIEASVSGVDVFFTITASGPSFSFEATRSTTAESGNTAGAVNVKHAKEFVARAADDDWIFDNKVEIEFNDHFGDRVEYEVTDDTDTTVGTLTHDVGDTNTYQRKNGNPPVRITPDDGYQVQSGTTYEVSVTGWDVQDNFDTVTRSDTA